MLSDPFRRIQAATSTAAPTLITASVAKPYLVSVRPVTTDASGMTTTVAASP
ncbi:hypothetical protein ACIBL3_10555 [Kribbella sp. NPDC050124]|uniref:hypothetical protein n=1 Tax=Kribbella sp. NPDC050124 TaxID=3364114 RepID=UPI0037953792